MYIGVLSGQDYVFSLSHFLNCMHWVVLRMCVILNIVNTDHDSV